MSQFYFQKSRENDPHALPDGETFCRRGRWYFWACFPGCLPDGDPEGPFDTEEEAIEAAREGVYDDEDYP
jgi:hypothetical protein